MKAIYKVDLTKLNGLGDFPCPMCRSNISPDDMDEKSYKVLEVRAVGDFLDELMLQCNKCKTTISVVGFEASEDELKQKTTKLKPLKGKTDKQILQLLEDGSCMTLHEITEVLEKKPKAVYKALRKLFEKGMIKNNSATRTYMIAEV